MLSYHRVMKSVVIKLSSALVMQEKSDKWLSDVTEVVANLRADGYKVCLVTSGATALGRQLHTEGEESRQFYAILGQPKLFELYSHALSKNTIESAQLLINKEDFKTRKSYLKVRDALHELLRNDVVPLINENDAIHSEQYSFSDNDEIGGLVASLLGSERLILASVVEGLLDSDSSLVKKITFGDDTWKSLINQELSQHGRGGMMLKCRAAENLAKRGISTIICSGVDAVTLENAALGDNTGTLFEANKQLPAKKRWILDHAQFADGSVTIDQRASEVMRADKATSLLTVGTTDVQGQFDVGDVITVTDPAGNIIGYGQAQLDNKRAEANAGKQSAKPLIHYDYYVGVS